MGVQSWGHSFPLAPAPHLCIAEDTSTSWGKRRVWLTLPLCKSSMKQEGRDKKEGKWELCLKLSISCSWHERVGKRWGFLLSALVANKEKNPKPVLKQLDSVTVVHLLVLDLSVASFCFTRKVCAWNVCFIYLFEVFSLWESLPTPHRPNISSFFVVAEHLTEKHSVWRKESCICQFIQLTHSILSVSNPPALRLILSVHQQNMILNPA